MTTTQQITTGSKVRLSLPCWGGPGCVVYTVEAVTGDEAIVREPRIPGMGAGGTQTWPLTQLVAA